MNDLGTLRPDHMLELPAEIAANFQPSDRFVIWMDGDTLLLKRLAPSPLDKVEQAPNDDALSLDEINEIIHHIRHN